MPIKSRIITTSKAKILVVGNLDEKTEENFIKDGRLINQKSKNQNWQLLGKLSEITESQWKEFVEMTSYGGEGRSGEEFKDYSRQNKVFNSATESGLSLLTANGVVLENKYQRRYFDPEDFVNEEFELWQSEQNKVFTNPVIFIEK